MKRRSSIDAQGVFGLVVRGSRDCGRGTGDGDCVGGVVCP